MTIPFWQTPASADPFPPSFAPVPQKSDRWEARHAAKLRQIAEQGASIDLVFLGDSITQALERPEPADTLVAEVGTTFDGWWRTNVAAARARRAERAH